MRDSIRFWFLVATLSVWGSFAHAQTEPAGTPAMAAPATSAFDLVLGEGKRLSNQGRYYDAALVYHKILSEGDESQPYFREAQYEMGVALFNQKLFVSAFNYFDRVAELGAEHPRYRDALPWFVKIHRELPGETNTLFRMAYYPPEVYPADMVEEISFYVGQYHYYEGNLPAAVENLSKVGAANPEMFNKALYLKGVLHVRQNQIGPAAETFNQLLGLLKGKLNPESSKLRQMARMALARVYYGGGQTDPANFDAAIRNYAQVPDTSEFWLDSLFERAWAYYQVGNYTRALGNLLTVGSPYFEEEYYPEAAVLKAVIFFRNCLYEEALQTIDPFYKEYFEISKELKTVLETYTDPSDFYAYLASISQRGKDIQYSLRIKKIFNAALADLKLRRLFGFVVNINSEMKRLEELRAQPVARPLVDFLMPDLNAFRALTMGEAGQLARERLARVNRELRSLLQQALAVRFESVNAQKGILNERYRREQIVEIQGALKPDEDFKVDREHVRWTFDGEYWKDELGSYFYPLRSVCGAGR
jgi:tetratricopeptide (TPR) repeat protein